MEGSGGGEGGYCCVLCTLMCMECVVLWVAAM